MPRLGLSATTHHVTTGGVPRRPGQVRVAAGYGGMTNSCVAGGRRRAVTETRSGLATSLSTSRTRHLISRCMTRYLAGSMADNRRTRDERLSPAIYTNLLAPGRLRVFALGVALR